MNSLTRLLIVSLIAIGTGCLHQETTYEERRNGIDLVGESSQPIRVGVTTRAQTIQLLGEPQRVSSDGRYIGYQYDVVVARSGFVFLGGPCGLRGYYPQADQIKEFLWLAFDPQDILSFSLSSRERADVSWEQFCAQGQ